MPTNVSKIFAEREVKYKVLAAPSSDKLETKIGNLMKKGWNPMLDSFTVSTSYDNTREVQLYLFSIMMAKVDIVHEKSND
jgi:hypothetical protein